MAILQNINLVLRQTYSQNIFRTDYICVYMTDMPATPSVCGFDTITLQSTKMSLA